MLLVLAPIFLRGSELIDPIPWVLTLLAGAGGAVAGFAIGLALRPQRVREVLGCLFGAPVVLGCIATYYARLACEIAAFTGVEVTRHEQRAVVESIDGRLARFVTVVPAAGTRKIRARVTPALEDRLDPYRASGRDCLTITVEVGRNGVRRTAVPGIFDPAWDVDRLLPCPAAAS